MEQPPERGVLMKRGTLVMVAVLALVVGAVVGVVGARLGGETATGGGLADLAESRGFTGQQAEAALKTFVPPGEYDEYYMFASGGHSGPIKATRSWPAERTRTRTRHR
jgi:nitrous oxide reductase